MSTSRRASARPKRAAPTGTRRWVAWLFLLPTFVLFLVFMVYPTIYTILLSFDRGLRLPLLLNPVRNYILSLDRFGISNGA